MYDYGKFAVHLKEYKEGWRDGLVGNGTCQVWWPAFDLWDQQGERTDSQVLPSSNEDHASLLHTGTHKHNLKNGLFPKTTKNQA